MKLYWIRRIVSTTRLILNHTVVSTPWVRSPALREATAAVCFRAIKGAVRGGIWQLSTTTFECYWPRQTRLPSAAAGSVKSIGGVITEVRHDETITCRNLTRRKTTTHHGKECVFPRARRSQRNVKSVCCFDIWVHLVIWTLNSACSDNLLILT